MDYVIGLCEDSHLSYLNAYCAVNFPKSRIDWTYNILCVAQTGGMDYIYYCRNVSGIRMYRHYVASMRYLCDIKLVAKSCVKMYMNRYF